MAILRYDMAIWPYREATWRYCDMKIWRCCDMILRYGDILRYCDMAVGDMIW